MVLFILGPGIDMVREKMKETRTCPKARTDFLDVIKTGPMIFNNGHKVLAFYFSLTICHLLYSINNEHYRGLKKIWEEMASLVLSHVWKVPRVP